MLLCFRSVARRQSLALPESSSFVVRNCHTNFTSSFYCSTSVVLQLRRQLSLSIAGNRVLLSRLRQGRIPFGIISIPPLHHTQMAGFGEPLNDAIFPTLGSSTSQRTPAIDPAERRTSAGNSASSLRESMANTSLTEQGSVSGGGRGGWANAPGTSATYVASSSFAPKTSQSGLSSGGLVSGLERTGAPSATGRGRDRKGKEVVLANEEEELDAATTSGGRRGGGARGRGEGRGGSGGGRGRGGDQIENLGRSL